MFLNWLKVILKQKYFFLFFITFFLDTPIPFPVTVKVLDVPEEGKAKDSGCRIQRYLVMDEQQNYITVSVFASLIERFRLVKGEWYRLKNVTANNWLQFTGIALRSASNVRTLDELGLALPDVSDPPPGHDNPVVFGRIVHFDAMEDYVICATTNKR